MRFDFVFVSHNCGFVNDDIRLEAQKKINYIRIADNNCMFM